MERFGGPFWAQLERTFPQWRVIFSNLFPKGSRGVLTESEPILDRFRGVLGDLLGHRTVKIAIWGPILMPVGCHLSILGHHFVNLFSKVFLETSPHIFSSHVLMIRSNTLDFCFSHFIFDCFRTLHTILETSAKK